MKRSYNGVPSEIKARYLGAAVNKSGWIDEAGQYFTVDVSNTLTECRECLADSVNDCDDADGIGWVAIFKLVEVQKVNRKPLLEKVYPVES